MAKQRKFGRTRRATVRPNGKATFADGHKLILRRGRKGQLRAILIEPEKNNG